MRSRIASSSSVEKSERRTVWEAALPSLPSWQTLPSRSGTSTPSLHHTCHAVCFLKQTRRVPQSLASSLLCYRCLYKDQA